MAGENIDAKVMGAMSGISNRLNTNISRQAHSSAYAYHRPHHHPHYHAHSNHFCQSCCHPASKCCCGHKQCHRESKELLVEPVRRTDLNEEERAKETSMADLDQKSGLFKAISLSAFNKVGLKKAIIGGGCCVHLSVEYMLEDNNDTAKSMVTVVVEDSENTTLSWGKKLIEPGYHIKEDIITVNPGAKLMVVTGNVIARVRWCEVFSC